MAKYNVKFLYTTEVNIEVDALDEKMARESAWEKLDDMSNMRIAEQMLNNSNLDGSDVEQID